MSALQQPTLVMVSAQDSRLHGLISLIRSLYINSKNPHEAAQKMSKASQ